MSLVVRSKVKQCQLTILALPGLSSCLHAENGTVSDAALNKFMKRHVAGKGTVAWWFLEALTSFPRSVELLEILARSIPYTHDADIDWQLSPASQNHLLLGLLGNSTFLRQENSCRKN